MMIKDLIKIDIDKALSLREKASKGDPEALKDYMLYSAWKKLNRNKGFSRRAKLRVLTYLSSQVQISWQTTSSLT